MAIKDTFNKMISYFDTDGVNEVEEEATASTEETTRRPQQTAKPSSQPQQAPRTSQPQQAQHRRPQAQVQARPQTQTQSRQNPSERHYQSQMRVPQEATERRTSTAVPTAASRREQYQHLAQSDQTTIALKYPRKYEDAQEIVDLLIVNECVLIDFQYMLDAQARRCLDFIDGASKVLYGTLQKVGSSMYLLTPSNVSVNIEEMNIPTNGQDIGFDFDMKRR
ncbi:cell division protein SepF [Streptococcus canis]|uniref:cell division protein SepF n=1 Tax=Streptococcus canis TaxID=1329 RepID=UPI00114248FB|nr:cell division protein SepF [Streptococcus canis]MDV6001154.1 cell division protein SepF [Streptococcus canis]MDW7799382.1 cell division protein SepF [Streptococcus canis]GEE07013.1 cell division protein SepF [Streptococcus canis]GFG43220.1 cell division protein SepF [Streptococcus canis]GFG45879.1 cell division protein SepF [Streptococcus canis]